MARIANFAALPQSIRDLEPQNNTDHHRANTWVCSGHAFRRSGGGPHDAGRHALLFLLCANSTGRGASGGVRAARGMVVRRQTSYEVNGLSGPVWHETRSGIHKPPGDAQRPSGKRRKRVVKPVQSSPGDRRSSTADTCASTRAGCRDNGHAVRMD